MEALHLVSGVLTEVEALHDSARLHRGISLETVSVDDAGLAQVAASDLEQTWDESFADVEFCSSQSYCPCRFRKRSAALLEAT